MLRQILTDLARTETPRPLVVTFGINGFWRVGSERRQSCQRARQGRVRCPNPAARQGAPLSPSVPPADQPTLDRDPPLRDEHGLRARQPVRPCGTAHAAARGLQERRGGVHPQDIDMKRRKRWPKAEKRGQAPGAHPQEARLPIRQASRRKKGQAGSLAWSTRPVRLGLALRTLIAAASSVFLSGWHNASRSSRRWCGSSWRLW